MKAAKIETTSSPYDREFEAIWNKLFDRENGACPVWSAICKTAWRCRPNYVDLVDFRKALIGRMYSKLRANFINKRQRGLTAHEWCTSVGKLGATAKSAALEEARQIVEGSRSTAAPKICQLPDPYLLADQQSEAASEEPSSQIRSGENSGDSAEQFFDFWKDSGVAATRNQELWHRPLLHLVIRLAKRDRTLEDSDLRVVVEHCRECTKCSKLFELLGSSSILLSFGKALTVITFEISTHRFYQVVVETAEALKFISVFSDDWPGKQIVVLLPHTNATCHYVILDRKPPEVQRRHLEALGLLEVGEAL